MCRGLGDTWLCQKDWCLPQTGTRHRCQRAAGRVDGIAGNSEVALLGHIGELARRMNYHAPGIGARPKRRPRHRLQRAAGRVDGIDGNHGRTLPTCVLRQGVGAKGAEANAFNAMHFPAWLLLLALVPTHALDPTVVDLPATGQWVDTGIDVHRGGSLSVTLNARRANARAKQQGNVPSVAGMPGSPLQNAPATLPALTGRIGTIMFAVSAHCIAPETGRLLLRVNRPVSSYGGEPAMVRARISYVPRAEPSPNAIESNSPTRKRTIAVKTSIPLESMVIPLPNVVGMKYGAAARSLKEYRVVPRRQKRSSSRPAGEVVDQSPAPGVDVHTMKTVILGVSDGSLAQPSVVAAKTAKPPVRIAGSASAPAGAAVEQVPAHTSYVAPNPAIRESSAPIRTLAEPPIRRAKPLPIRQATPEPIAIAAPRSSATTPRTPIATATPRARATVTATSRATGSSRAIASAKATPVRRSVTQSLAPPIAPLSMIAVPQVIGSIQQDAAATINRANLHAIYRGAEPSRLLAGRITRTDPVAGTRLKRGSLVGYWVATAGTLGSGNGWTLWLFGGGLILTTALLGFSINNRMRLAKVTRSRLTVHPSLELDGPTSFAGDVTKAGPTTHLRASVELGEAFFEDGGATAIRKEQDG
jgi:beta-lactam-binding protein with PASTA domain